MPEDIFIEPRRSGGMFQRRNTILGHYFFNILNYLEESLAIGLGMLGKLTSFI